MFLFGTAAILAITDRLTRNGISTLSLTVRQQTDAGKTLEQVYNQLPYGAQRNLHAAAERVVSYPVSAGNPFTGNVIATAAQIAQFQAALPGNQAPAGTATLSQNFRVKLSTGMPIILTGVVKRVNSDTAMIAFDHDTDADDIEVDRSVIDAQYNDPGQASEVWNSSYFQNHPDHANVVAVTPQFDQACRISLNDSSSQTKGFVPFIKALRNACAKHRAARR